MSKRDEMESVIRRYFEGCNEGSVDKVASCFLPDAVHYFPPGMYGGAFARRPDDRREMGRCCQPSLVRSGLSSASPSTSTRTPRVAEWTHYKTKQGTVLRGDEWYEFDPSTGLISEIRAYYASPQARDLQRLELEGFDYAGRGYSVEPRARDVDH